MVEIQMDLWVKYKEEEKMYTKDEIVKFLRGYSDHAPISWIADNIEVNGLKY